MTEQRKDELEDALNAVLNDAALSGRPVRPAVPKAATPQAAPVAPSVSVAPAAGPAPVPASAAASPAEAASGPADPKDKRELLAAYDRLVEHEATKPTGPVLPIESRLQRYGAASVAALSTVLMLYIWIAKPAWLYPRVESLSPPATELEAEQELVAAAVLAAEFYDQTGRYPVDLGEIGIDWPSLSIGPDEGGFRIVGGTPATPMYLRALPGRPLRLETGPR
ncbi:MAG: hypothetical protein FJ206_05585 [Gemmatimonadetes bacterium]|nr:hypothetical protein [Gemmatimonadota bacterium]